MVEMFYVLKPHINDDLPTRLENVEVTISFLPTSSGKYYGLITDLLTTKEIFFKYFDDKLQALTGCQKFLDDNYNLMTYWKEGSKQ